MTLNDKIVNFIKNIFNILSSVKLLLISINMLILFGLVVGLLNYDIFYVSLESYIEEKLPKSAKLIKYIEQARLDNFYNNSDAMMRIERDQEKFEKKGSYWTYNLSSNRDIYKILNDANMSKEDLLYMRSFYGDLNDFYFDLINYKYKFDRQRAFYDLKDILNKHACKPVEIHNKYSKKLDWHKTIVNPIYGLVFETLFFTQSINDEFLEKLKKESQLNEKLVVVSAYGTYFLTQLFEESCKQDMLK